MPSLPEIDVAPLIPEARAPARNAAMAYIRHLHPWFIGLVLHGSALKGGVIPGSSDIDFQLYLSDEAFDAAGQLSLQQALAIHRDLARIDLGPFISIQCVPLPSRLPEGWTAPIAGAYHVIAGSLPLAEATSDEVRANSRTRLDSLTVPPFNIGNNLLDWSDRVASRMLRLLGTDVWPTLYAMFSVQDDDPLAVWRLPKTEVIERVPAARPEGREIRLFYQHLWAMGTEGRSLDRTLAAIATGVRFLGEVRDGYRG
jgi:hypothetical protein